MVTQAPQVFTTEINGRVVVLPVTAMWDAHTSISEVDSGHKEPPADDETLESSEQRSTISKTGGRVNSGGSQRFRMAWRTLLGAYYQSLVCFSSSGLSRRKEIENVILH